MDTNYYFDITQFSGDHTLSNRGNMTTLFYVGQDIPYGNEMLWKIKLNLQMRLSYR